MMPHPFVAHERESHATHVWDSASHTSGEAHAPHSRVAPQPSVTVPHAAPRAVQLSTGHALQL
jgi:hypothetical protein